MGQRAVQVDGGDRDRELGHEETEADGEEEVQEHWDDHTPTGE